jgi:amidase
MPALAALDRASPGKWGDSIPHSVNIQQIEAMMAEAVNDSVGAFMPGPRVEIAGAADGPLSGLGFAVKDLFDVAGHPTTYGNPDWARTNPPAAATAPVVQALLQAGAGLRGKTKTVELAYGLTGENVWYGTPVSP